MKCPKVSSPSLCAALLLVTVLGSASARIAVPTSDYNNVDIAKAADSEGAGGAPAEPQSEPRPEGQADVQVPQGEDDPGAASGAGALLPWTMGAVRVMRKVYLECRDEDLSSCLKVQVVRAMDRVARSTKRVALMAGVTLERDPEAQLDDKVLSKDDLENALPRSLPERERSLDKLILDRIFRFFQNYSLRFKLPSISELSSSVEDARRRRPPINGLLATGLMLGGSLLPMKFGMLAMLAGKALMLSKLALLISALMAMRNMGGGGGGSSGGGHSSHH